MASTWKLFTLGPSGTSSAAGAYSQIHDMGLLGVSIRVVCCSDGSAGEGRRLGDRLQSCYCNPNERNSRVYVGDCAGAGETPWTIGDRETELGVFGGLGNLYRTVLAVLLSRVADGTGV